jgi:uncharacterized FlaG/YvyC family protein
MDPLKPAGGQTVDLTRRNAEVPDNGNGPRGPLQTVGESRGTRQTEVVDATPAPGAVDDGAVRPGSAEQNAEQLRELARSLRRKLEFEVSEDGRMVIDVRDAETGELIRTIPPEAQARMIRALERGDASLLDSEA